MKKEIRNIASAPVLRAEGEGDERRIDGYAVVFDSESLDLGGFREKIAPGALDGVLERSDVLALYNHNADRGVLARSNKGKGSLELTVDEKGLQYSFGAPNTALGDEVLEGVRRGDISGSSFAFTVAEDRWEKEADGRYLRTILRFEELFDVSPVIHPAYQATSVDTRGLDELKAREQRAEDKDPENKDPDKKAEDEENEEPQEPGEDNQKEPDKKDDKEDDSRKKDNNIIISKRMKKEKFSLLRAIRNMAENRDMDEVTAAVHGYGREAISRSGICDANGNGILLPLDTPSELRFEDAPEGILSSQNTAAEGFGGEAVPTELFDVVTPLRERLIISQLGARMLTLSGNVEIPVYSGANCKWANEIEKADKAQPKFSKIKMEPKRITALLPISKQFLLQTSPSVEAALREDLINCIAEKIEATIFSAESGKNNTPVGMFDKVTADSAAITFEDVVKMEETLELAKVYGEKKYVLSPSAKAILRVTKKDAGSGLFVMDNNEVLGTTALSSGVVVSKGMILGDWSKFYFANFGALDLTIDPYHLADSAQIRLIINMWVDYAVVRPEAFVKRILTA